MKHNKEKIQISDSFTYKRLIKFTIPSIIMMIMLLPVFFGELGLWLAVPVAEIIATIIVIIMFIKYKKVYNYL